MARCLILFVCFFGQIRIRGVPLGVIRMWTMLNLDLESELKFAGPLGWKRQGTGDGVDEEMFEISFQEEGKCVGWVNMKEVLIATTPATIKFFYQFLMNDLYEGIELNL